ncbi:hypothetical protein ACQR0Z_06425 [Bradyrhizobium sp. HKCCYLS3077]|uniref:hypothetical protein n=1 Tax=Bradyrhizobium sp. HKCCYLS3077 TaxID=3420761 RepID=UPI003EBCAAE5
MDVDEFRREYMAEIEKATRGSGSSEFVLMSNATGTAASLTRNPHWIHNEIALFRDETQSTEVRLAALRNVQTATFMGPGFAPYRAAQMDALRAVALQDPDQDVRRPALEILAMEKDDVARQLLLTGVDDPGKAVVPIAKAVQLLAHDDHGVAIPLAHKVVAGQFDVGAKEEALRVLAADLGAGDLFARIMMDRAQPPQLRSISASSLREVDPTKFEELARKIVVDDGENDEVRANCLGALDHLQGYSSKADPTFTDSLSKLDLTGTSEGLRSAASRYLKMRSVE